jgi:uncharacterized membrane protein YbhN (UPF0104 family)
LPKTKRTITPVRIMMFLIMVIGIYYLLPQLGSFQNTFTILRHASWFWIIVGLIASCLSFFAGAVTQFAAGNSYGRLSDIALLQFAGSFINHFLPFSVGGVDITARYYQKHGLRQTQAITVSTIPIIFGIITTVGIVAIVSPITLVHVTGKIHPSHFNVWLVVSAIAIVVAGGIAIYKYRQRAKKLLKEAATSLRGIQDIRQLLLLIFGSIALTSMSSLSLYASILAVHASVTIVGVFVVYVTSSLVSDIAPTPGGIGATEAVLVLGLVAARITLPQAAAATLTFRLLTFWLPIIPGALALRYLKQQKILL